MHSAPSTPAVRTEGCPPCPSGPVATSYCDHTGHGHAHSLSSSSTHSLTCSLTYSLTAAVLLPWRAAQRVLVRGHRDPLRAAARCLLRVERAVVARLPAGARRRGRRRDAAAGQPHGLRRLPLTRARDARGGRRRGTGRSARAAERKRSGASRALHVPQCRLSYLCDDGFHPPFGPRVSLSISIYLSPPHDKAKLETTRK